MFLTVGGGTVIDFDLQLLREVLQLLDAQLDRLEAETAHMDDPDGLGIHDSAEYIAGLGFAACQCYLVSTYGCLKVTKDEALMAGPKHRSGYTIAALVNHAANFWKHHEEWPLYPDSARQKCILAALAALQIDENSYPLTGVLAKLVLPTRRRFHALLSHLEAWRDDLATAA